MNIINLICITLALTTHISLATESKEVKKAPSNNSRIIQADLFIMPIPLGTLAQYPSGTRAQDVAKIETALGRRLAPTEILAQIGTTVDDVELTLARQLPTDLPIDCLQGKIDGDTIYLHGTKDNAPITFALRLNQNGSKYNLDNYKTPTVASMLARLKKSYDEDVAAATKKKNAKTSCLCNK